MPERLSVESELFWKYADRHGGPMEAREAMRDVLAEHAPEDRDGGADG